MIKKLRSRLHKTAWRLLLLLAITGPSTAFSSHPDTLASVIGRFLDKWHDDAAACNHDAYIGAMTPGGVFIGTDATENWTTDEFSIWSKPFFERKKSWKFKAISRNIHAAPDGNTAWFDELLETQMGICRGSGVLLWHNGNWKIAQYVLSATIPNALMNQVTRMKSAADSALVLKNIFDNHGLTGTIIIYDKAGNRYIGSSPERWDSGYLPASTFKIPNSLIGLETGLTDTAHIFKWNGEKRRLPQWEKDLTLTEAFRVSCVPCYQELARQTGFRRMNEYLLKIKYPGMDVQPDNIDLFWLEGKSRITPRQQVDFLMQLYDETLPLKPSTMKAVKTMMVNERSPGYTLSGKTGWAVRNGNNYGWFTGWLETGGNVYFFATLVEPKNQSDTADFAAARKLITMEVLRKLGVVNWRNSEISK